MPNRIGAPTAPPEPAEQRSLMLAAGIDIKIVQHTLGHVTSAYTRDTYTSVYPQLSRDAAENTAALLTSPQ